MRPTHGAVQRLIARGFDVQVPTDGVKPVALPIAVSPTMMVRGQAVELGIGQGCGGRRRRGGG